MIRIERVNYDTEVACYWRFLNKRFGVKTWIRRKGPIPYKLRALLTRKVKGAPRWAPNS